MIFLADTLRTIQCFCLFCGLFGCRKIVLFRLCFEIVFGLFFCTELIFFAIRERLFLEILQIKCIFARILRVDSFCDVLLVNAGDSLCEDFCAR